MNRLAGVLSAERNAGRTRLAAICRSFRTHSRPAWHMQATGPALFASCETRVLAQSKPSNESGSDSSLTLAVHATLYNRTQLARTLEASSAANESELIARAYRRWGIRCVDHLEGDFAFALWDHKRQRLFCARDPLGLRPLFYRWDGRSLAWASEVKALTADPDYLPAPEDAMLGEYLLGWSHFPDAGATFFRGIRQLPAGHTLTLEAGRLTLHRYWDVDPAEEAAYRRPLEENVAEFRRLLERAVRRQLTAPPAQQAAILLSGGLDSTSLACVALTGAETNGHPSVSFLNYYFPAAYGDERDYVRAFQQRYGCPVTVLGPNGFCALDALEEAARANDTPFPDPTWSVSQRWARRVQSMGADVLLTGFGGDNTVPDAVTSSLDIFSCQGWRAGRTALAQCARSLRVEPRWLWRKALSLRLPPRIRIAGKRLLRQELSPWLRPDFARRSGVLERVRQPLPRKGFTAPSQELTWMHLTSGRLSLLLASYDSLAAAHGFELRHPFFDPALVRLCLLAPWEQHTEGVTIKVLLREAMRDLLPEPIRRRQDKGTPDNFLRERLRTEEAARLRELAGRELLAPYVRPGSIAALCDSFLRGESGTLRPLLSLLSLELWMRYNFARRV